MERFLRGLLPRFLPPDVHVNYIVFRGKHDLLKKIPGRLKGLRHATRSDRIFVLVDRDSQDCKILKGDLEQKAAEAGMATRTISGTSAWQLVNRIVIEELEAWYFGDWLAVVAAYPDAPPNVPRKEPFRNPDRIRGGTSERFCREMKPVFQNGFRKTEAAERIGSQTEPSRSTSPSFQVFWEAVIEAVA